MDKVRIRKQCLEARRALPAEAVAAKSAAVRARLKGLSAFGSASAYLCYVSSKDNEVDTVVLMEEMIGAEKLVLVPIANPGGVLAWSRLESLGELAPGRFGILEPRPESRRIMTPPPRSLAIVPGIAFTPDCRRIGYGGGCFDRFLATHGGTSIGLAFEVQIVAGFDAQAHDVPVDYVVTESRVITRTRSGGCT
jgi:5-formyltetrahydrofolate cyclo-ligase